MKYKQEILIDDAAIIIELDLAKTFSLTDSYRRSNNPAYVEGFIFGQGKIEFNKSCDRSYTLFDDQEIGNVIAFLEWFEEAVHLTEKGAHEIGTICLPGQLAKMLQDYFYASDDLDTILNQKDYERLQSSVIESRDSHTISCYTIANQCWLEVAVNTADALSVPRLATWHREIIPETLAQKILTIRKSFVDAYEQYVLNLR